MGPLSLSEFGRIAQHARKGEGRNGGMDGVGRAANVIVNPYFFGNDLRMMMMTYILGL